MQANPNSAPLGVVLAAGEGQRLRPLTLELPKALCPVGNVALVDLALARLQALAARLPLAALVVNAHHHGAALVQHLEGLGAMPIEQASEVQGPEPGLWVSWERQAPLGTAGALARIARWFPGRDAVVINADAYTQADLMPMLAGVGGAARVLVSGAPRLDAGSLVAAALVPAADIAALPEGPSGLYRQCWEPRMADGTLEVLSTDAAVIDCGKPGSYLQANMAASGGRPVIGQGAEVKGQVVGSVVWPGAVVEPGEHLRDAIRTTAGRTVLVR